MVAKGKYRWTQEPSSPSRRVASETKKLSNPETSTTLNREININDPSDDERTLTVSFSDEPLIHDHIRKQDYEPEEKQASFWSAADLKQMREEMRGLVLQFEKGVLQAEEGLEAYVIERYTRKETIQRKRLRKGTVQSLLTHQKSFGVELSEIWLAKVYIPETNKSQEVANMRAIPSEQKRLVAPPAHQEIVRHTLQGEDKSLDTVNEMFCWSSILYQVIDYCASIQIPGD